MARQHVCFAWKRFVAVFLCFFSILDTVSTVTHYSVPEEMDEGSVVANLAADLGLDVRSLSKRKMRVDVVGNKKYLDINKDTGELFILERIDREFLCPLKTTTSCFLRIDATIENPVRMTGYVFLFLCLFATWSVVLSVTHYSVPEEMEEGSVVANLAADLGLEVKTLKTRRMRVDVVANKKYLDINKDTGELYILERIDREFLCPSKTTSYCFLKLDATIENPIRMFNIEGYMHRYVLLFIVFLIVRKISSAVTHYTLPEEMKEGTVVANLATDLGLDVTTLTKRKMRLDIIANKKYLDVNKETGELYIVEKIDREHICTTKWSSSCYLKLEITLENPLRIFNIEIEVLDMNDNAPHFRRDAIHLDISEATPKGERFSLSNAVDPDVGTNSVKTYYLSESEYFNIEIQTGRDGSKFADLILIKTLDREKKEHHNLILTAVDGGTPARSGTVNIFVHVLDTNDNAPTFDEAAYNVKVMENSPIGSLVIDLNASDLDDGSNSDISYSYNWRRYVLTIFVFFAAFKSAFAVTHYSVPEELEEGSVVANLAGDLGLDVKKLIDRKMRLDTIGSRKYLDVNKETGELFIVERIDRESLCPAKTSCYLKMEAIIENPKRIFYIELEIMDINDNAPHFRRDTIDLDISEATQAGERFSVSNAVDPDVGSNALKTYHLSESDFFTIEIQTGRDGSKFPDLILKKNIDREEQAVHNLILTAVDGGLPSRSGTASIIVHVLDTNDNAPKFKPENYEVSVLENSPIGSRGGVVTMGLQKRYVLLAVLCFFVHHSLTSVSHYSVPEEMKAGSVIANLATDLSLDVKTLKQRKMRVDIIANKKYLDVNKETGELYIVEKIDREQLCNTKSSCFLKLEVILDNPVRIFNIEVEILDINDNAPRFRRDVIHLDISEAAPKGERFSLSNAVDPDVGLNSVKTYHLSKSEYFNIEVQPGRDGSKFADLILKKTLDREKQAVHNLILTAVDDGTPTRSGTASVIVRVLDTNDNAPTFEKAIYDIKITENSPIGSLVIRLNATDLDEGSNSDISYSYSLYTSEKTQETFNLNPTTGEITVKGCRSLTEFRECTHCGDSQVVGVGVDVDVDVDVDVGADVRESMAAAAAAAVVEEACIEESRAEKESH
ncbi:hypothetical protein CCH79_00006103 [Gambusia affinis]|uniref:Cadherin domain-containing protein n=1 Tax=Gambusia affinis TaxID=33528 RepID=A0A315VKG5_GAMAF|nr:hypothetical protein CCH79_00006103 [Gambusia affinis]